jgi:D-aminoacyl-tRNA deacylase
MRFVIIASEKDEAGKNIFKQIQKYPQLKSFIIKDKDTIFCENLDKQPEFRDYDFFIFITKHQSQQHNKTLSVHAPGNWNKADFGGYEGKISPASSFFLKHIFQVLNKNARGSEYSCTLEVTHHGPYIEKPCCFIEIGSKIEEWQDEKAARIIAETVHEAIKTCDEDEMKSFISAIGIGGPHYCPNFNKIQLNSGYALGHIIPEYALPLTEEMLAMALEKTIPKPEIVLLDWKGLGKSEQRQEICKLLEKKSLKILRTSSIEK